MMFTKCSRFKSWLPQPLSALISLFLTRLGSVILVFLKVDGIIIPVQGGPPDIGSCATNYSNVDWPSYQEHIISIVFQLALLGQLFLSVLRSKTPMTALSRIFDLEVFGFIVFLWVEVLYLLVYHYLPSVPISFLNTFYFNTPIVLYIVFAMNFWMQHYQGETLYKTLELNAML